MSNRGLWEIPADVSGVTVTKVILVTGASGLIGRAVEHVVSSGERLQDEKWVFVDRGEVDLTDLESVQKLFAKVKPTHVVHLAAMVGGIFQNLKYNLDFMRVNTSININVLNTSFQHGVAKVVSCLSKCSFPDNLTYPIDETMLHSGPPSETNFGFAYAKRLIDIQNKCYADQHGCKFTSVIPASSFGPHDNFSIESGHEFPSLLHRIYLASTLGTDVTVCGSDAPMKQFVYSRDLAKLLIWALREYDEIDPIFLAGPEEEEVSVKHLVELTSESLGYTGEVKFDTSKPDGQLKQTASNAKLRKYLPEFQFTPMKQAVQETCDWLTVNYNVARK